MLATTTVTQGGSRMKKKLAIATKQLRFPGGVPMNLTAPETVRANTDSRKTSARVRYLLLSFAAASVLATVTGTSTGYAAPAPKVLATFTVDRSGTSPVNTYTWTVPKGIKTVTFDASGASGGGHGGGAGEAKGAFSVKPGMAFEIVVGGKGGPSEGGLNGGGPSENGFGGGGGSDVRAGSCAASMTCTYGDRIVVAGGGGGGGGAVSCGSRCLNDFYLLGGGGGGVEGSTGPAYCDGGSGGTGGGSGGTQLAAGAGGGCDGVVDPQAGSVGSFGAGGGGGFDDLGHAGGGGGGGWFGGGGGSAADHCSREFGALDPGPGCGGGGGSGHVDPLALSASYPAYGALGDGHVVIYRGGF